MDNQYFQMSRHAADSRCAGSIYSVDKCLFVEYVLMFNTPCFETIGDSSIG